MSRIEVRCICGKSYDVPADKAGRRLQCRRCGNVQRIPSPEPPAPRPDSGLRLLDAPADPSVRRQSSESRAQSSRKEGRPLRRCPACGLQDESGVVVCVRCGYDWRTGKRLRDADEAAEEPEDPAVTAAQAEADQLASLSWLSLSPAGIVVGPYIAWRSQALEARLRRLRRLETSTAVRQVRLTAISGAALWLVVLALLGVLLASRSSRSAAEVAQSCRQRLEQVGRTLRERIQRDGEFPPPGRDLPSALQQLLDEAGQGDALICPAHEGLHPFRKADHPLLTLAAEKDCLIAWDREPHADGLGALNYRALRLDGTIEVFASPSALAAARERPAFPDFGGRPPQPVTTPVDPAETPGPNAGPAPEELERHLTRLLSFAYELDDEDPELDGQHTVTREAFLQRLELTPEQLLPVALADPDPKVRVPAVRLTARLELPPEEIAELVEPLAEDPQVDVRLVVGLLRQARGDERWLPLLCDVAEAGDPHAREVALTKLGEAAQDVKTTRRILAQAMQIRGSLGARGDEAIFPLPESALPFAVELLDDGAVSREAMAVLYSGQSASLEPLRSVLGNSSSSKEVAAVEALDLLRRAELLDMQAFLDDLERANSLALLEGLRKLVADDAPPPPPLEAWALAKLREGGHANQLRALLLKILQRLPGTTLIDALREPGMHATILSALRRRTAEPLDDHMRERWDDLPDPRTREDLAKWLASRFQADSVRALVHALEDEDEGVRLAAAQGLVASKANRPLRVRRAVARAVAERLDEEESVQVLSALYRLASEPIYCSSTDDEHTCETRLINALRSLARKGETRAIRAMGTHANRKTASLLLRMLDSESDNNVMADLAGALRGVTGSSEMAAGADFWKQQMSNQRDAIETYQAERWNTAWGQFQTAQEYARRQLERLGATE